MEREGKASPRPNVGVLSLWGWNGVLPLEGHLEARLQRAWCHPRHSNGSNPQLIGRSEDFEQESDNHGHSHWVSQKGLE